jgi:cytochrome c553
MIFIPFYEDILLKITVDYREKASGIIDLLSEEDIKDLNEYLKSIFPKLGLGE